MHKGGILVFVSCVRIDYFIPQKVFHHVQIAILTGDVEAGVPWFLLSVFSDFIEHWGGIGSFFIESAKIICFIIIQLLLNFGPLLIRKMFERCAWYDGYFMIEISIILILVIYKLFHWCFNYGLYLRLSLFLQPLALFGRNYFYVCFYLLCF